MSTYYPRCQVVLEVLLEDLSTGGEGALLQIVAVPREATWTRDTHRQADTFQLRLPHRDLPLDPRAVRAIRVILLCGDVGTPSGGLYFDNPDHVVFLGYVDQPEVSLESSGEDVLLEGRDCTALFLDHTWSAGPLDVSGTLADVVAAVLEATPGASTMPVVYTIGAEAVVLADVLGRTRWTPGTDADSWSVLVELCARVGLIPVVELDTLAIRSPDDLSDVAVGFQYGGNVERLTWRKKYNEARSQQVQVVCWDPATRTTTEALYPTTPPVTRQRIGADGKAVTPSVPQLRHPIVGSYSSAELEEIAAGLYTLAARQQIEGVLVTRELDGGGVALPTLGHGAQVQIFQTRGYLNLGGRSKEEAIAELTGAQWRMEESTARTVADAWEQADRLAYAFFVQRARHRWTAAEGYRLEIEFINYVLAKE